MMKAYTTLRCLAHIAIDRGLACLAPLLVVLFGDYRGVLLGLNLYRAGRYRAAAALLSRLTASSSFYAPAWACLGYSHYRMGNKAEADKCLLRAIHRSEHESTENQAFIHFLDGWRLWGEFHNGNESVRDLAAQRSQSALELARACNDDELTAAALQMLGPCHPDRDLAMLESHCRESLRFDPQCAGALCSLGWVYACRGKWAEAVDLLSRSVKVDDANANAHYELGNALCYLEQWKRADKHFRLACVLGCDEPHRALYGRALCLYELHRAKRAKKLALQALACCPDYELAKEFLEEIAQEGGTGQTTTGT
jgi:tetratricopeptide (TPR) repeat protein